MSVSYLFRRRAWLVTAVALVTLWSSPARLTAQGERITLPRRPGPNQTLAVHLTQDIEMQMTPVNSDTDSGAEGQPPAHVMPPMKMTGVVTMEGTQKVGETDDEGRTPCEFAYTDANMDMKMNGMSVPNQDFKDQFVGKSMTFSYAADGTVTNLKLPESSVAAAGMQNTVQQALSAFTLSMPTKPMSVGESAKMPLTVPLALPLPGGVKPPSFVGTVTYTLVRVEGSGANRVAVLEQKVDATANGSLPTPGGQLGVGGGAYLTMHMVGTGQMQMDLTRGVTRSGEVQTTMDGNIEQRGGPSRPGMPSKVRLQGSTKMTMSTRPQEGVRER